MPYGDHSFDFAVFITSICFINDPSRALEEAYRVIQPNGDLNIAFIDKTGSLGQTLTVEKKKIKFYKTTVFYLVREMISLIEFSDFEVSQILQTLTDLKKNEVEKPMEGFGKGGFIVIKARKK